MHIHCSVDSSNIVLYNIVKLVSKFWSIFFSEKVPKYSRQQASMHKSTEIAINISHMCINTNLHIDVLQIVSFCMLFGIFFI